MKRVFSILTFIALVMAIGTPSGLAAIGKVLSLDGDGDYVEIVDSPTLNSLDTQITIEAWIKADWYPGEWMSIIFKGDEREQDCANRSFAFWLNHNGYIYFTSAPTGSGEIVLSSPGGSIQLCTWYHIAGVIDAVNHTMKLLINGNEVASTSYGDSIRTSALPLRIGWHHEGEACGDCKYFAGLIDEVRIWNIVRTEEEIQDAMNRTLTSDEINSGNVVGYWNFDDGDARDLSLNHNDGNLMGDARIGDLIASFTAEPRWGEAPLTVQFTDCSYGENITGWSWDFGDDGTSIEQNPIHEYQNPGDYTISLTITSPNKSDTVTRSEYIHVGNQLEWNEPALGKIEQPGEVDLFCFSANAGDIIVLDVDAQLNGSPLNSYLRLYDESRRELAYNDNTTDSLDSMIVYVISTDGTYCVEVGDVGGNGGSNYFYILFLRKGSSISGNVAIKVDAPAVPRQVEQNAHIFGGWLVSAENIITGQQFAPVWTNIDGNYILYVPDGNYRVKVQVSDVTQYFDNVTNPGDATVVTVTADTPATDINFLAPLTDNGYITQGLVLGPLRNTGDAADAITQDFLASIGGEVNVIPHEGNTFEHEGDVLTWQGFNFGVGHIFDQIFGYVASATVYVATYVKFDEAGEVDLWVGFDDTIAVWFNGENVWTNPVRRDWTPDVDKFQVTVQRGWNRLLIKVSQNWDRWSMSARFPNVRPIDISLNPDVIKTIGDVSDDGTISAYDASLILQFVVGLIDTLPPTVQSPADGVLRDYSVSIPELTTRPGNSIKVPVAINDATGLTAGGIILKYDQSVIRAVDALPTSMLSGAYWKASTQRAGEIRFAFAAAEPIKGAGNLLMVEFEPLNNTVGSESPIIFETVQFAESKSIRTIDGKIIILPEKSMLMQNYPNPFNPETWIPYQLAEDSSVMIKIYNVKGELVRTLSFGHQSAGVYIAKSKAAYWDGRDNLGEKVASGVYFYRLQTGNFSSMRRLVVLK